MDVFGFRIWMEVVAERGEGTLIAKPKKNLSIWKKDFIDMHNP